MNEEKQIAQAIFDAQKMKEDSYNKKTHEYKHDIEFCLKTTCKNNGVSTNLWALLSLAMHWWNDIQLWAEDILAGRNSEYTLWELLKQIELYIEPPSSMCREAYNNIIKALPLVEQLQAELDKHRWIPMDERPPEVSAERLFFILEDGLIFQGVFEVSGSGLGKPMIKGDTMLHWYAYPYLRVTHWKLVIQP